MDSDLVVAYWKIRESQRGKLGQLKIENGEIKEVIDKDPLCEFSDASGSLSFTRNFSQMIKSDMPHIGYAIPKYLSSNSMHESFLVAGDYFDCGTPDEYFNLVNRMTA